MPAESPNDIHPKRRRLGRILGRSISVLILVLVLALVAENYRGHWVWRQYRQQLEAQGESLEIAALAPPAVAPEQNFATTPFFQPFFDYAVDFADRAQPRKWRDAGTYASNKLILAFPSHVVAGTNRVLPDAGVWQLGRRIDLKLWRDCLAVSPGFPKADPPRDPAHDVLNALRRYDAVLNELRSASERPASRFPVHYNEHSQAILAHLAPLKGAVQIVQLRALAHLEAGESDAALADIQFGFRLAESLKSERWLISGLVRLAEIDLQLQPVWEGLAERRWSGSQVRDLQAALERIDVLADYGPILRMERAGAMQYLEELRQGTFHAIGKDGSADEDSTDSSSTRFFPGGILRQNQLSIARFYQEKLLPIVDAPGHRVDASAAKEAGRLRDVGFRPYSFLADLLLPAIASGAQRFARAQTSIDLAGVACALERHRLAQGAQGTYPERLDELVPKFIAALPRDVIDGGPLRYRTSNNGHAFVLYSIGWNETDEDGTPGSADQKKRLPRYDPRSGDWVWKYF